MGTGRFRSRYLAFLIVSVALPRLGYSQSGGVLRDWVPVAVGSDVHRVVTLQTGDSLTLTPMLRNTQSSPVEIRHRGVLFFLEGTWRKPNDPLSRIDSLIPPPLSWGLDSAWWRYPNPNVMPPLGMTVKVLAPGERYSPPLLWQRSQYRVPFDAAGTYFVRVCANVNEINICEHAAIKVIVIEKPGRSTVTL